MAQLEPITKQFIDDLNAKGGKPLYELSAEDARNVLENIQASADIVAPDADIEDIEIPFNNTSLSLRIVRPVDKFEDVLPVIMYFHGGGWILGSKFTHDRLIRDIANGTGYAVVFVEYTRSPEAQYPTAIEQAYAATKYMAENGHLLALDGSRLAVAGDSVGGNMATVVALLAKYRNGPHIKYQVLFYPVTNSNFYDASYKEFSNGPWLSKKAMEWYFDAYEPDHTRRVLPTISPLQATTEELANLPPALVIVDENDVLRDEGEAYAHKLMDAGVEVTAVRYLGTIHDFVMLNPLANTPATRNAIALANGKLVQYLQ